MKISAIPSSHQVDRHNPPTLHQSQRCGPISPWDPYPRRYPPPYCQSSPTSPPSPSPSPRSRSRRRASAARQQPPLARALARGRRRQDETAVPTRRASPRS